MERVRHLLTSLHQWGLMGFTKSLVRWPRRTFRALRQLASPTSNPDIGRWSDLRNFDEKWDARTSLLASYVPEGAQLIEFGAGRGTLRKFLRRNVDYTGSDIIKREEGTLVWDLNRGFPPTEQSFSHAILSGVFEYLADPIPLVDGLSRNTPTVVLSYCTLEDVPNFINRVESGWLNHFSERQLVSIFAKAGFKNIKKSKWIDCSIYVFEK